MMSQPSSGPGHVQDPQPRDEMPQPVGPSQVRCHEHQAHQQGRHGKGFADNDDLLDGSEFIQVRGDDQQHRGRCHSDQEGEIPNVEAPGNIARHPGFDEPVLDLL